MNKLTRSVAIVLLVLLLAMTGCTSRAGPTQEPPRAATPSVSPKVTPPSAPVNLAANAVSQSTVTIQWLDNSNNEDGFRIYRGNRLIGTVGANVQSYQDTGLQPATSYQYAVIAYNQVGESQASITTVKTLNPPITIRLDRIGVHDNREPWIRGNGDVYVLIGIVDENSSLKLKFPPGQDETYSLDKNETINIGATIYSTDEVGDSLTIAFKGYESDGGNFEQLAYQALGMAVDGYVSGGAASTLLQMFDINLGNFIGNLLGQEHDWLGSYELTCNHNNNWHVGQYTDIVLQDERGVDCLRLWFTIESPR